MLFLGTGAAELFPDPFCRCEVCEKVRRNGESGRKRSAFLFDPETCIDFGPEVLAASLQYNAPLYDLRDIFITHTHDDHLCPSNFGVLGMTKREGRNITVWLSEEGHKWVESYLAANDPLYPNGRCPASGQVKSGWITFKTFTPYEWHDINGKKVFAVVSNHGGNSADERALNYIIEKDGRRFMYVSDSGLYSQKNLDALRSFSCDILVMEGTFGSEPLDRAAGHLNAAHFVEQVGSFEEYGIIKADAPVYVTHINPKNTFCHSEYQEYMDKNSHHKVFVAYDGLTI